MSFALRRGSARTSRDGIQPAMHRRAVPYAHSRKPGRGRSPGRSEPDRGTPAGLPCPVEPAAEEIGFANRVQVIGPAVARGEPRIFLKMLDLQRRRHGCRFLIRSQRHEPKRGVAGRDKLYAQTRLYGAFPVENGPNFNIFVAVDGSTLSVVGTDPGIASSERSVRVAKIARSAGGCPDPNPLRRAQSAAG
jgi:hypothetical protein